MNTLEKVIKNIFKVNLAVKKKEKVLIVIDKNKRRLGKIFLKIGNEFTKNIDLIEIPVGKVNGGEPPKEITKKMLTYNVELLVTTKSLTHTKARKNASKKGARIVTLPNITEATLKRALNVDYKRMHKRIARISNALDKGKIVNISTELGTNLTLNIKGRKAHGRTSGIFTKKGKYGNLPDGESFIAPVEGTAKGIYIIDGSVGSIGKVDKPIKILVEKGYVKKITGGKTAKQLQKSLNKVGKKSRNIAEFGIGANNKAIISGNMLEDEKVMGTCHIALGNNTSFGGKIEIPLHIDGLIKNPTILIDNKKIMQEGKLIL